MIPFFKTTVTGTEQKYLDTLLAGNDALSKKEFTSLCEQWFRGHHGIKNFFLTKSCTHALELAALVLNIQPGDEVILPSYAFVSCANAFALRGAVCVFIDIRADDMNLDETKLEDAISEKTKAIVCLNYAGVACSYASIRRIADKYKLPIVEDNAHGTGAKYHDRFLGTFGDIATFSFDQLKNITCIQGGGIALNNDQLLDRFYLAYEFGTNRRAFFSGQGDRYEWKSLGTNSPLSELSAAMLWAQVQETENINDRFRRAWRYYAHQLAPLAQGGKITLPNPSDDCRHNGHCFYLKTNTAEERNALLRFLQERNIQAQFHYTPLHNSAFGKMHRRPTHLPTTEREAQRLLRLPLYYQITEAETEQVVQRVKEFFS